MKTRSHSLQILFPLGLLGAFAALAVMILLQTASLWQESRAQSQDGYYSTAAASYLTEKLRQSDTAGAVTLTTLGQQDALMLSVTTDAATYDTYLYCYEGALRELMVNRTVSPDPAVGRSLLPLEALDLEPGPGDTLAITCRDGTGGVLTVYCALRGEE